MRYEFATSDVLSGFSKMIGLTVMVAIAKPMKVTIAANTRSVISKVRIALTMLTAPDVLLR